MREWKSATPTFNAGVIALDLEALRAEQFASRACDLLSELGEHASYADQSAFNALLAERWHELPKRWNTPSWAFDQAAETIAPCNLALYQQRALVEAPLYSIPGTL